MKILLVANVGRGHVNKFHIPTIQYLQAQNWQVEVACSVDEPIEAGDNIYAMCWKRSPFTFKTIQGIFQLKDVKRAVIEQNGQLIVVRMGDENPKYPVITDGVVQVEILETIGKSEEWLTEKLKEEGFEEVSNIFIAEYDKGQLNVVTY